MVQNSIRNEPRFLGGVTHFSTNGIRSPLSAANRISTYSNINDTEEQRVFIYDHLCNLVTKTLLEDLVLEGNLKRSLFNINTGNHWIINKAHKIKLR